MGATFTVSRSDLLRSKTVKPGWYKCKVKSVEQSAASTDGSTNTTVEMTLLNAGDFTDVPVRRVFNEKAAGFAVSFLEAMLGKRMTPDGGTFDMANAKGREIFAYVKNDTYQNRMVNVVEDFLPVGKDGQPLKLP